jgi:leucyl/phenylalanyl-tRNA--protein transferase
MSTITPQLLLRAYTAGIFPMAESAQDNALYWVEPEIRGIIPLEGFHVPRKLAREIRQRTFRVTMDQSFDEVIAACAGAPGSAGAEAVVERPSTWINARIAALYSQLHKMGCCHSIEVRRQDGSLAGGLYGVRIGAAFFGESMFSAETGASKVALVHLVARLRAGGFQLLDTQFVTDHLKTFGCIEVPKEAYRQLLDEALVQDADFSAFAGDGDPDAVLSAARSGR